MEFQDIDDLPNSKKSKYWWNYGEIGQKLVEKSRFIKNLLRKNFMVIDGHSSSNKKFNNFRGFFHLDIVIHDNKNVKAICEVKTTKNKSKKEFKINGECGKFMIEGRKNKIPLFFAVVRLKELMPLKITTKKGFDEVLKNFVKNPSNYEIEFYSEDRFLIEEGFFKIK
jgi:hypothetical protein